MASYNARQREPFLDGSTYAALQRRGMELIGLALIGLAGALTLTLATYVPDDPSWMAATDAPAQNALGRIGAAIAAALFIIIGHGAWAIAAVLAGWGLRLVTHQGAERALSRAIFAPLAVALASVYASTLVPHEGWVHSFGLGGLFGDTVLGALVHAAPVQATLGLKVIAALLAAALVALGLFVLGANRHELRLAGQFLLLGLLVSYAALVALGRGLLRAGLRGGVTLARGAGGVGRGARHAAESRRA
ncbi:DNA translocase FtsK, partial [Rhodobacteraceae bacterium WD3A24]